MLRLKRVIEGFTTVVIGVMVIASSMGELSWRVWLTLFSLWPLLLIAIGLDLLGKGARLNVVRVLSSLVILGGVLYVALLGPTGNLAWTVNWTGSEEFAVRAEGGANVDEASARIAIPAASIDVTDGRTLLVASGQVPFGAPTLTDDRVGDRAELELATESGTPVFLLSNNMYTTVELGRQPSWDLVVDVGATEANLELAELRLSALTVQSGIALLNLELGNPDARDVPVRVETGLADVSIRVPEGAAVRVEADYGMGATHVPAEWDRMSGERVWESEGYATARTRYLIVIETGMGVVDIEQY